jgi:ankyrin repeat protein
MSGHHEIVKILFAAGADPESKNFGGWSLLEYATEKKDEPLVRAIMERLERKKPAGKQTVAERDQKSEALAKAAEKGDTSMLGLLIRQGANINGLSRWGDETPLMKAAYYGKTEAAAWLIDHGATIEARDSRGNTALLHAAWMGKVGVVELLLKKGADVNALNNLGWNALMQAALEGHHETAKILLEHGARTDFIDKEKGATAYYLAQRSGSGKTLEVLKEYGAQPRVWRALKPGEPRVDIRECEYCQYIPQGKELANAESLGDYPGLIQLHTHSTEVDRYATSTIDVFKCKLCWSYYQNDHYIDTEDSFVAGPTIHRHLQRFNFERLKMALLEYQLTEENAEFSARLPHLIATMKEVLAREGSAIHPHFLRHFIENVTDSYILAGDWERLKRDLLSHTDKKLALRVADDLIIIFGEGKYASAGGEQVYKAYRHITPDVYEQTKKILAAHSQELKDILKAIRAEGGGKAVDDVLKSAKYYKI